MPSVFIFSLSHFEGDTLPFISIIPSSSSMAFSHCLFGICFLSTFLFSPVFAQLQRFHHSLKDDGSLSFLVVGDWGRQGAYNQSEVALQMGRAADEIDIDFVVSTGDNFYDNGLASVNDPLFEESFTKIYTANSLQKQWYSVLGNHDYRGNVEAQLDPVLTKIDSRWLCRRSFVVDAEIAEFFFVDTTPFVDEYFVTPNEHSYDWKGVEPRKKYIGNALQELESALRNSHAKWKIVVGHHAIRSMGHHGDTNELVKQLLPILQANDVDFYINGHDHCLEHISDRDSPIQFFTSGGGSKAWRGDVSGHGENGVHLVYDGQGFMSVELNHKKAKFVFYDVFGRVIHKWHVSKPLHSAM